MTRFFDDPAFETDLFFPSADDRPAPPGARDLALPALGGAFLHARVHAGPASPRVAVVLFHGNGEVVADWDDAAPRFAAVGARLAVVDYRGYGRSTGTPSLRALLGDARPAALALLPYLVGEGGVPLPVLVMGRSLGSACAAEIARSLPRFAAGFVFESGFSDLRAFARRRGVSVGAIEEADLAALCPLRKLAASRAPLLVLHGAADRSIDPAEGRAAHAASGARLKRLVIVPGRGHNDVGADPLYDQALGAFATAQRVVLPVHLSSLTATWGEVLLSRWPIALAVLTLVALIAANRPTARPEPFRV